MVTVGAAENTNPVEIQSDTNSNFSVKKGGSYQFRITAPGASAVNFGAGTAGVFNVSLVSHIGDDFYYKITAVGEVGKETGIYTSFLDKPPKTLCGFYLVNRLVQLKFI